MASVKTSAKNQMEEIQTAIGDLMNTKCKSKSSSTVSADVSSIKNSLPSPTWINGYSNTLSDGVYKAIAKTINATIGENTLDKYSAKPEEMVIQIASQIKSGLKNDKNTVTVDNVNYTVTVDTQTFFGIGNKFIDVTWESTTNKSVVINTVKFALTNVFTDSATKGIAKYCAALLQLNNDVWKDFVDKMIPGSGSLLDLGEKTVKALTDQKYANKLIKNWPNTIKSKLKNNFRNFVKDSLGEADSTILFKAVDLFKTLESQYKDLDKAISNDKDVENKKNNFVSTCNELQSLLGLSITKLPGSSTSKELAYTNKKKTEVIVPSGYKNTLKETAYGAKVAIINAASRTKAIKITGNNKSNTIYVGKGNDTVYGGKGNDSLFGNEGKDKLYGGVGKDILNGGKGDDSLFGDADGDKLYGGVGNDTLKGGAGADKLYGEAGKDKLYGGTGNDELDGGAGNDDLYGEDGHDIIYGGTGNDKLNGDAGNDVLFGGVGNDTLDGGADNDTLFGDASDDIIYGNIGNDKLYGGTGNDTLDGGAGNDTLDGGAGNDTLKGGTGNDILYGGTGNDILHGGTGKDAFWYDNGDGNDTITDYANDDIIWIGNGKISQAVYSGMDTVLTIGKGSLTLKNTFGKTIWVKYLDGTKEKYVEEAKESNPTAVLGTDIKESFDLSKYNLKAKNKAINIDARNHNDDLTIYANERANVIWAGNGGSSIYAGRGNDVIYAGNGRDYIYYDEDGGDDIVYNFRMLDRLLFSSDSAQFKNVSFNGDDVIVNLTNGRSITLKEARNEYIDISDDRIKRGFGRTFGRVIIEGDIIKLNPDFLGGV